MIKKKHLNSMISKLLEMAGDKFSNHGCNDLPKDFYNGMSETDIKQLYKDYHEWNGDLEDYNGDVGYLGDDSLMNFLSEYIKED